jgi:hypothetical protein
MNPFDATYVTGPLSERRSPLDVDEPDAWHNAITPGPDLLVQHPRPIVADLVGPGRTGLGALMAPPDPMVIIDGWCHRLDAGMSACRVSPLERALCHGRRLSRRQPLSDQVLRTPRRHRAPCCSGVWRTLTERSGGAVGHLQRRDGSRTSEVCRHFLPVLRLSMAL